MPEGDTIFRTARTLRGVLAGRELRRCESSDPGLARAVPELAGRHVTAVDARGKNLLIRFDDGRVLYSHMRMSGSWHVYRPGELWRKPRRRARVVLETDDAVAVCFSAPVVRLLSALAARHHRLLEGLGPDLLADGFDAVAAARRLRSAAELPVGEALLDQRLVAGIGNVYKSETLFLCGIDPFRPVESLADDEARRLIETTSELMHRNLGGGMRRTRFRFDGGRYWVYGRSGSPCRRCGETIRMDRQGSSARSTYHCPRCQPASTASGRRRNGYPAKRGNRLGRRRATDS